MMGIQSRAALIALLMVVVVVASGAGAVAWQEREIGRMLDRHALESVRSIQSFAENSRRRELELKSEILSSNPSFVGYVAQALAAGQEAGGVVDAASIRDLLEERRVQYGFDIAAVLDASAVAVVMLGDPLPSSQDFSALPMLRVVRTSAVAQSALLDQGGHLLLVTVSPMLRGSTIEAFLVTGVEIDDAYLTPIARAGHVDLALLGVSTAGYRLVASTLDANDQAALLDAMAAQPPAPSTSQESNATEDFALRLSESGTRAALAPAFESADVGVLVSIVPVAQRSVRSAGIRTPMLAAGALVLLVVLALWIALQRGFVGPFVRLVEMSDRVLRGDIQVVAREVGKGDVSRVAAAFNQALTGLRGYKEFVERRPSRT